MTTLVDAVSRVLRSGMNEYDPIPHWAAKELRAAIEESTDIQRGSDASRSEK